MPGAGGGGDRGCCAAGPGVVVTSIGVGSRGGVVVDAAAHAAGSGVAAHAAACGVATSHAASCGGATHVANAGGAAHGAGVVIQVVGAGAGVAAGGAGVSAGGASRTRWCRGARWSGMRMKVTILLSCRNCISKDVKFQRALPTSVSHGAPRMTSMLSPMERRKASI